MTNDGPDPALLAHLSTLDPREELVMRLALREAHDSVRADRDFSDRIKFLLNSIDPRPREMAAIIADARDAEKQIAAGGDGKAERGDAMRSTRRKS